MRKFITTTVLCAITLLCYGQENNPLINSGELIEKAIQFHDEGKYKSAIEIYKKIPRGDTNYYRAVYEMAYSQMTDSQYAASRKSVEIGLAEPNDRWAEFYTLYGNILDDMGEPERALRIYDSAIVLYPAFTDLYLNKGTTLIKLKRYAEAEEILKQTILINPYVASAHYKLGVCAIQRGAVMQTFLSHINYLLIQPNGRYQNAAISSLSTISKAGDEIKALVDKRAEDGGDNFPMLEKIMFSKIALDKKYKPLLKLDDPISRQIQVVFEKIEYDEKDTDFWMQYYVPLFKKIFEEKKFEPFINRLFANVNVETIQDYVKKNKKEIEEVVNEAVEYYNQVRNTREINYAARKDMNVLYHHENGKLYGKGTTKENGEKLVGNWEFYYSAGNLRSKGVYNDNGERNGPWQYYHFNGKTRGKQLYKDGKLEGEEAFYFENGNLSSHSFYKNGEEYGESKSFYLIGLLRAVAEVKEGKLQGSRKIYFSNGSIKSLESYIADSLSGPFKTYYSTGPLESQGTYKSGEIEGSYKAFHTNGKLSMEGTYSKGKLNGPWKQYHENGKLKLQENFVNGTVEGEYIEYYDNGQLFYKCNYKNGKCTGDVEYFDRDGKKFFVYTLDNDITKTARYYDKTGKEIGVSERKAKKLDLTTYYSDGYKRSQAVYNDKAQIIGTETYFYRTGKPSSEANYADGALEGPGFSYYANGNKQVSTSYKEGEKHGYEKNFFSHGQVQDEGWYQDGNMEGNWLSYDELGNATIISEYLNNDLHGYKTEFYPNGKKSYETKFTRGWIEEFVQFDSTGKELSRSIIKNGNGKYKILFFNGKTFSEGAYKDGELDGAYTFYFFDGKVNTQQFYKRGALDSTYRNYYYGGQLLTEGQYKNGKKDGLWKNYFSTGKLNYTETYLNGEVNGKRIYYFQNGKVDTEIEMEKGERNGWTKKYDEDGSLQYQTRFAYDVPQAYTYLDKNNQLVPEIAIRGGSGDIKSFFANGKPSADFSYANSKLNGSNKSYHSNGKLRSESMENFGLSEGNYKFYHANGKLQYEYNYLHDNVHGPYKEFNDKGMLLEEGYYYNGVPHNTTKTYDDAGKLKETRTYYYGKLLDVKK